MITLIRRKIPSVSVGGYKQRAKCIGILWRRTDCTAVEKKEEEKKNTVGLLHCDPVS